MPSLIPKVAYTSAKVITHVYVVLSIFGLRSTNLDIILADVGAASEVHDHVRGSEIAPFNLQTAVVLAKKFRLPECIL